MADSGLSIVIKTSDPQWLEKALKCYIDKSPFTFVDDMGIGITQDDLVSAVKLIKKARDSQALSWKQIAAILVSLGISGAGVWLIYVAIVDPEATSKLWLLLAGGVTLILTGGLSILRALGITWKVRAGRDGIEVSPQ